MGVREDFDQIRPAWQADALIRSDMHGAFARCMLAVAPGFIDFIEKEKLRGTPKDVIFEALANVNAQLVGNSVRETVDRKRRTDFLHTMLDHIAAVAPQYATKPTGNLIRPDA